MLVTESGMVTVFTSSLSTPHVRHERSFIVVVPSGMLKCPSALMLTASRPQSTASEAVINSGMDVSVNEVHPLKALLPMAVTESGMVMLANELHP